MIWEGNGAARLKWEATKKSLFDFMSEQWHGL